MKNLESKTFEPSENENASERQKAEKLLESEANINSGLLYKIARNPALRKAFYMVAFSVGLLIGQEALAQQKSEKDGAPKDTHAAELIYPPAQEESPEAAEKRILVRLKEWFEQSKNLLEKYDDGWKGVNYEGFDFEYVKQSPKKVTDIDYGVDEFCFGTSENGINHEISFNPRFTDKKIHGFGISRTQPDSSYTLKTYQELGQMGYILRDNKPRYYKEFSLADIEQFMNKLPNQEQIQTGLQEKEEAKKRKEEQEQLQKESDKKYLKKLKPQIDALVTSEKFKKLEFGHEAHVSYEGIGYRLFYRGDALFIEPTEKKEEEKSLFIRDTNIAILAFDDGKIIDYSNGLYKHIIEELQK